jgi:hypothetical protein
MQGMLALVEVSMDPAIAMCCVVAVSPAVLQPLEVPSLLTIEEAGAAAAGQQQPCPKPGPGSSTADKSKFIQDKYVARKYVAAAAAGAAMSREAAQQQLWDAVGAHDIR